MIFANLLRVHAQIAWRQKILWYTSIPLTLLVVLLSFGGRALNIGDVGGSIYRVQVIVIFVGIVYIVAFTSLLSTPARLGIGELESFIPVGFTRFRMAQVLGPFVIAIMSPLAFPLVMGMIQTVQGKWDGLSMALAVTVSTITPAMLCSIAISTFMGSPLPQAFARIVAVLARPCLVFSTPAIPVLVPEGTIFGVTGDAVAQGYFGPRSLYVLISPFSSFPGPVTVTASLLWQLTLIVMLLAIGSHLSERFRDR